MFFMSKLVILFINVVVVVLFLEVPFFLFCFVLSLCNFAKRCCLTLYCLEMFVFIYCLVCFFKKRDYESRIYFSVCLPLFVFGF